MTCGRCNGNGLGWSGRSGTHTVCNHHCSRGNKYRGGNRANGNTGDTPCANRAEQS
jgi:hypothetical protein